MEQEKIRQNLKKYIEIVNNKNLSVGDVIDNFGRIFDTELIHFNKSVDQAYYNINTYQFYIKDSCGINLTITSGPGDILGKSYSHKGKTVSLSSHFARNEFIRNGITIIDEDINILDIKDFNLNNFFDIDLSLENIKQNFSSDALRSFPEVTLQEMMQDNIFIFDLMNNEAIQEYRKLNEYADISPYGGLDVELKSVEQILFNNLNKFKDNNLFFSKGMYFFNHSYPDFLDNEIEDCKQAIYIIENKDKYEKMLINKKIIKECETDIYYRVDDMTNLFDKNKIMYQQDNYEMKDELKTNGKIQVIEDILKDIKQKINNWENILNNLNDEAKQLIEKNYSITNIINGQKRKDMLRLEQLGWVANDTLEGEGKIAEASFKIIDYKNIYDEIEEKYDLIKSDFQKMIEMEKTEFCLKYEFKNYTIYEDLYEQINDDINDEFGALASLSKLVDKKDEYIIKFNELKKIKADIDVLGKKMNVFKGIELKGKNDLFSKNKYDSKNIENKNNIELNYKNEIECKKIASGFRN